jgi:hypothetical protein
MIQLYLLSIVLNGLSGFILLFGEAVGGDSPANGIKFSFSSWGFRLILGILTGITGILKLLSPVMNRMPILGDMLPGLGGIGAGFILVFSFYRENSTRNEDSEGRLDRIGDAFLHYKKVAGIALLIIAALHFMFPTALFL